MKKLTDEEYDTLNAILQTARLAALGGTHALDSAEYQRLVMLSVHVDQALGR